MPSKRKSPPRESGGSSEWMSVAEACRYICAALEVGKDHALLLLARWGRDGMVQARGSDSAAFASVVIIGPGEGPAIIWQSISPEEWDIVHWLRHSGNSLPGFSLIEINAADLTARTDRGAPSTQKLKRQPKSPGRPLLTGNQKADAEIHKKMHELLSKRLANSAWDAARHFLSEARGTGSDDAKRRRLTNGYKRTYGE